MGLPRPPGHLLYEEVRKQRIPVGVVGVPKSIDNDVKFVDRTFGFDSAVEAAASVIRNGWVEVPSVQKNIVGASVTGARVGM